MNSLLERPQGFNPNAYQRQECQDSDSVSSGRSVLEPKVANSASAPPTFIKDDNDNNVPSDNNNHNIINSNNIWPTPAQVAAFLGDNNNHNNNNNNNNNNNSDDDKDVKQAWVNLLQQETDIPGATYEWFPFPNALYLLLFIGRYDPTLAITRNIINYFIKILKTLKQQGFISNNYKIPGDGSEVERLWSHLPQLPLS